MRAARPGKRRASGVGLFRRLPRYVGEEEGAPVFERRTSTLAGVSFGSVAKAVIIASQNAVRSAGLREVTRMFGVFGPSLTWTS